MKFFNFFKKFDKNLTIILLGSVFLALFWVVFLWNFWEQGIYSLGFNATIFGWLFLGLFIWLLYKKKHYHQSDLLWIIPFGLIMFSYSLYDNPFLKITSLLILPIVFIIFYNQAFLIDKKNKLWDLNFIGKIVNRFFSILFTTKQSINLYFNLIISKNKKNQSIFVRSLIGLLFFLIIALTIFIPLLSSADAAFADKFQIIYNWFLNLLSLPVIYKLLIFIVLTILFSSGLIAWSQHFDYPDKDLDTKNIDSIISGIILSGILSLYLLFLWLQINHLWMGSLPFDFKETVSLVKSGFWQLLFLSIINILIYFFTYKKTASWVQTILKIFTIVSLLLLVSAAYRMGLYVIYYGLSYEKFFASYTVIYCAILFIWLIVQLFIKKRANILKFLIVLFFWMYAIISVLPIEQFIFQTNFYLSSLKESRIRLFELSMLSPDVLSLVKKYNSEGLLIERAEYFLRESVKPIDRESDWAPWIARQEKIISEKTWYEKNLTNILYLNNK